MTEVKFNAQIKQSDALSLNKTKMTNGNFTAVIVTDNTNEGYLNVLIADIVECNGVRQPRISLDTIHVTDSSYWYALYANQPFIYITHNGTKDYDRVGYDYMDFCVDIEEAELTQHEFNDIKPFLVSDTDMIEVHKNAGNIPLAIDFNEAYTEAEYYFGCGSEIYRCIELLHAYAKKINLLSVEPTALTYCVYGGDSTEQVVCNDSIYDLKGGKHSSPLERIWNRRTHGRTNQCLNLKHRYN